MGVQHLQRHAVAVALLLGLGCGAFEPTAHVVVATSFPNPDVARRIREVSTTVLALAGDDPSPCPGLLAATTTPATTGLAIDDDATRALDPTAGRPAQVGFVYDLPLGTKALYGEARDEAGVVFLRGCVTSSVTDERTIPLPLIAR